MLIDGKDVARSYGINSIPSSFFIDRDGKVATTDELADAPLDRAAAAIVEDGRAAPRPPDAEKAPGEKEGAKG